MADRRVACVSYGGGHITACLPVLSMLRDRGWDIDLLALTLAAPAARAAGFAPLGARDLLRPGDDDVVEWGAMLAADLGGDGVVPYEESVAYLGFGYAGLVAELGEEGARDAYAKIGRRALRPIAMVDRLLERGAAVAIATSSPRAERALIECARERGVPAVCINNLFAPKRDDWLFDRDFADRICVIHASVRDELVAGGQDPGKIEVTGNPAFERFIAAAPQVRWAGGSLRVLYISQLVLPGDEEQVARFRRDMVETARQRSDWRFIVRPAPAEHDLDWIKDPLEAEPTGTPVLSSLLEADVLLTHGSTMALEGALLGLPVLQQTDTVIAGFAPFHRIGLARRIEDYSDIAAAIAAALAAPPSAATAAIPMDATSRVVAVIEDLA